MLISLNSLKKLRLFAEGEPSMLSESFLLAGVTFLGKINFSNSLRKCVLTSDKLLISQLVRPLG